MTSNPDMVVALDSRVMPEYSVTSLSTLIKRTIESIAGMVQVRGEISGLKLAPSGHLYFSLKDEQSLIACIAWRGTVKSLSAMPVEGMAVLCRGRLTTYPGQSKYQLIVEHITGAGAGALMELLEKRKKLLAAEGLFDAARKRALPLFPQVIGVITSPTGAVIQDILHRLRERYPVQVIVWPVLVQGDKAAGQITQALQGFNRLPAGGAIPVPDVIIVARGGGSIEDLWPFNEENVVRAVAASSIPIISAVGHETDTTLCDFAADLRAPTPSAAAEKAVPDRLHLYNRLSDQGRHLTQLVTRVLHLYQHRLKECAARIMTPTYRVTLHMQRVDECALRLGHHLHHALLKKHQHLQTKARALDKHLPYAMVQRYSERLSFVSLQLEGGMKARMRRYDHALDRHTELLSQLDYRRILKRGYTALMDSNNHVIASKTQLRTSEVSILFHDGTVKASITPQG